MMRMILVPAKQTDREFWRQASVFQFIYSVLGLVLGLACAFCGVMLFFHGIAGSSNWAMKVIGVQSHVCDAAPGVILFVIGLFVVYVTRYGVRS